MGAKVLVGALVGALAVCGGVWRLGERRSEAVALAAPTQIEERRETSTAALEAPRETRVSALEPELLAPAVDETEPGLALTPREIAGLVADLRDDDVKGNALRAVRRLSQGDDDVVVPLEGALRSNDWQQRQLAAMALVDRQYAAPSQVLADVLVEGLEERDWNDGSPDAFDPHPQIDLYTGFDIHEHSREVLSWAPPLYALAEPGIARLLTSASSPTRFSAARVLAVHRSALARERVLATLIEHLEDNQIAGDARIALPAIAGYGAEALPALEHAWPGRDEQQRALLGHLFWTLAPAHACAHELKPADFHALGFSRWNPLPLEDQARTQ